jgi:hypothetical protein
MYPDGWIIILRSRVASGRRLFLAPKGFPDSARDFDPELNTQFEEGRKAAAQW